jgi:hypothetical protein
MDEGGGGLGTMSGPKRPTRARQAHDHRWEKDYGKGTGLHKYDIGCEEQGGRDMMETHRRPSSV